MACRDPVVCAVRALGMYLILRYTCKGDDFPDPTKGSEWNEAALWPANNPKKNVSYGQQAKSLSNHFIAHDIITSKKAHSGRVAAACTMDEIGVPSAVRALLPDTKQCSP